jgi:hypothetical protein
MYWLWQLYSTNIPLLRQDLKDWKIHRAPGYEYQADILNTIMPTMIDKLDDTELMEILELVVASHVEPQPEPD